MNFAKFMQDFFDQFASMIQIGIPAKIITFDQNKMRADVQPLMNVQSEDETVVLSYPILSNIPVQSIMTGGFYIRPVYLPGDLVWVTFSTFDIASALNGVQAVESDKTFSMENACVSGGITLNNFSPPAEFGSESGLIIGSQSGQAYMSFKSSEIDFVFGGGAEKIKMSAAGIQTLQAIKAGGEVTALNGTSPMPLSTHLHLAGALISAAPGNPVTGSTAPPTAGS